MSTVPKMTPNDVNIDLLAEHMHVPGQGDQGFRNMLTTQSGGMLTTFWG